MVVTTPLKTRVLFLHSNRDNLSDLQTTCTLCEEQRHHEGEWYHEINSNSISNAICASEMKIMQFITVFTRMCGNFCSHSRYHCILHEQVVSF